jgi:hypothetical protein
MDQLGCSVLDIRKFTPSAMNLFAIDTDFRRSGNTEANFTPVDRGDGDRDAVIDDDRFADFASENEHGFSFREKRPVVHGVNQSTPCAKQEKRPNSRKWARSDSWGAEFLQQRRAAKQSRAQYCISRRAFFRTRKADVRLRRVMEEPRTKQAPHAETA